MAKHTYSGIYKIVSISKPDRCYIGSTVNLRIRKNAHFRELQKGTHNNPRLQGHYDKYGKEDLMFIIVEPCFPEYLLIREQYYIDKLNPSFNLCKKAGKPPVIKGKQHYYYGKGRYGKDNPFYGKKHSKETKDAIGKANKGRIVSEEMKKIFSERMRGEKNHNYGKKFSKETRQKLNESRKKYFKTEAGKKFKKEQSVRSKNFIHTEESKKKRSDKMKGDKNPMFGKHLIPWNKGLKGIQIPSDETRRKISEGLKGRKYSPESIKRMSEARKKWWRKKRKLEELN